MEDRSHFSSPTELPGFRPDLTFLPILGILLLTTTACTYTGEGVVKFTTAHSPAAGSNVVYESCRVDIGTDKLTVVLWNKSIEEPVYYRSLHHYFGVTGQTPRAIGEPALVSGIMYEVPGPGIMMFEVIFVSGNVRITEMLGDRISGTFEVKFELHGIVLSDPPNTLTAVGSFHSYVTPETLACLRKQIHAKRAIKLGGGLQLLATSRH